QPDCRRSDEEERDDLLGAVAAAPVVREDLPVAAAVFDAERERSDVERDEREPAERSPFLPATSCHRTILTARSATRATDGRARALRAATFGARSRAAAARPRSPLRSSPCASASP